MNLPLLTRATRSVILQICSSFVYTRRFLSRIRDLHEWNLLIRQSSATNPLKALSLFQEMRFIELSYIFKDDPFIYASLVKACGKAQAFLEGACQGKIWSHGIR